MVIAYAICAAFLILMVIGAVMAAVDALKKVTPVQWTLTAMLSAAGLWYWFAVWSPQRENERLARETEEWRARVEAQAARSRAGEEANAQPAAPAPTAVYYAAPTYTATAYAAPTYAPAYPVQGYNDDRGAAVPSVPDMGREVHVRGYTRKDGTYVQPHTRSAPGHGRH